MTRVGLGICSIVFIYTSLSHSSLQTHSSQASIESNGAYILCRSQSMVRTIRVEKAKDEKKWVAYYNKLGVDQEVAKSQNLSSCTKVIENIKENLIKANWACKEIQKTTSTVTSTHE